MRYLLLSVLAVCMIGVMIPSVFADKTVFVEINFGHPNYTGYPPCAYTDPLCFHPNTVIINLGDKITWVNNWSYGPHTVTSGDPSSIGSGGNTKNVQSGHFDSGLIGGGAPTNVWTWQFNELGTYPYFCMIHPWMTGTVIVKDGSSTSAEPTPPNCLTDNTCRKITFTPLPVSSLQTELSNFDLQKKLDEYWNCAIGEPSSRDCVKSDKKKHAVGISPTDKESIYTDYRIEKDGTLTLTYEKSTQILKWKLEKFRDKTLHQELWDIYKSITPPEIMSEASYFTIDTDDYVGDEAASVSRTPPNYLKFLVSVDPVDMFPSGIKIDKQYYVSTMIHENAHILSLNSEQGNNDSLEGTHADKQIMLRKQADCAPNYYNDVAGCLNSDSYLNVFFQRFWAEIYPEHRWNWEFETYDEYKKATNPFYFKYKSQFVTDYAGNDPDEDFAETFMAFVLKEKPQGYPLITKQKILFFYEYPELVEMRDFIRSAIATSEFCDNGTVWKDGKCQKNIPQVESDSENVLEEASGCLIATAAFGSEMAPQVQLLREIRDNTVLQTESGTSFMTGFNHFYYSFSPYIADYERENPAFKETVKLALTPLLTSLTLLQYADIDSESEMLGYGIGVILLNIGMYFVAPAVLIMAVRKRI